MSVTNRTLCSPLKEAERELAMAAQGKAWGAGGRRAM